MLNTNLRYIVYTMQRQQAGRAGRRKRDSLAVFIAEGLPIDQYYLNNPNELFDKDTDDLIIDLDNKIILEGMYVVFQ